MTPCSNSTRGNLAQRTLRSTGLSPSSTWAPSSTTASSPIPKSALLALTTLALSWAHPAVSSTRLFFDSRIQMEANTFSRRAQVCGQDYSRNTNGPRRRRRRHCRLDAESVQRLEQGRQQGRHVGSLLRSWMVARTGKPAVPSAPPSGAQSRRRLLGRLVRRHECMAHGAAPMRTYERSLSPVSNGTSFPCRAWPQLVYQSRPHTKPTFFGCNATNTTNAAPLIVYLPNYPYQFHSNISTFSLSVNNSERDAMIANGWAVATQLNGTRDADWPNLRELRHAAAQL